MNRIRLIIQSIRRRGIKETADKIQRRFTASLNRLPVHLTYCKLRCLVLVLKRDKPRTTNILGYRVAHQDIKSLYIEFKDIFKNQIYHFTAENDAPTIIDGGGFIGLATLYFKYHFPAAKITVFEPSPDVLPLLKKNIEQNHLRDVTIVPAGLGRKNETVSFAPSRTDAGKISNEGSIAVQINTLSQYLAEPLDYLKLNIEGSERDVLQELDESGRLGRVRQLCFEWHSFAAGEQHLDECLRILQRNGFRYLINHFDYLTNRAVRPPFSVTEKTQYYLLVYARKTS